MSESKIGVDLRLVKHITDDLIIHHEPISYDLYCQHWQSLSQLVAKSFANGLGNSPLAANTMLFALNDIASDGLSHIYNLATIQQSDIDANDELVSNTAFKRLWAFVNELKRRTNVITPANGHYDNMPLITCIANGTINRQEEDKVLSNILFFTSLNYAGIPAPSNVLSVVNCQCVSLSCVEYQKHLQKLIASEGTKKAKD